MRYTYLGFNQERAVILGLDGNDLTILRWFVDYKGTGKMVEKIIDGKLYSWVKYEAISEAFPIMNFKKDTIYRRMKKMANIKVLEHATVKDKGVYSFYALGENYLYLIDGCVSFPSGYATDENPNGTDINPIPYGRESESLTDENPNPYGYKSVTKNKSINNKSIKEINLLNNNKEKDKKEKPKSKSKSKKQSIDEMINEYTSNEELINTIYDFIEMRKTIKKPVTERAMKIAINTLEKYAKGNDALKIAMIEKSITNCWTGIFELKEYNKGYNNKPYGSRCSTNKPTPAEMEELRIKEYNKDKEAYNKKRAAGDAYYEENKEEILAAFGGEDF